MSKKAHGQVCKCHPQLHTLSIWCTPEPLKAMLTQNLLKNLQMTLLHHYHATLSAILLPLYSKPICLKTNLKTFKPAKTLNQDHPKAQKLCDHMESSYNSTYLLLKSLTSTLYSRHSRNLWANFLHRLKTRLLLKTESAYVKNQWQAPLCQAYLEIWSLEFQIVPLLNSQQPTLLIVH